MYARGRIRENRNLCLTLPQCVFRQLGGGFDFASTALRVNFNDLQPDRVFPQERFYLVSQDGHLLLLSLRDDPGEGDPSSSAETPLAIESLYHIQPPLQNGEIVSVCGCGETIVLCRHSGSIVILRSSPAPLCQTSVSGLLMLSQHGCSASQQDTSAFELEQVGARNRASQKDKLDATAAKADHSALEPGREEDAWTSAYYLLDARAGNGVAEGRDAEERASVQSELGEGSQASSQLTLLVAVVSRLGHAEAAETCGGRTRCRLQRIHLERSVASGPWQLISSVGVDVGAAVPPLARLWPSRDQILMASSQAYGDEELSDQGNPATRCEDDIAAQAAEYDDYETGYDRLVHLHMPVRSGQEGEVDACSGGGRRWKVRTYMLHDTAASSGPLTWIGLGGPESSAHGLPAVGLGAKTGLGMHDLHVMRVSAVLASAGGSGDGHTQGAGTGDAGPYALASEHVLTFPAVGYIQKGKTNKKGVTFSWSSAVPSAFILDAEDGLHAYESNTRGVLAGGQESTGGAGQTGGDVLQSARGESSFKTQKFVYGSAKLSTKARQSSIDVGQEACGGAAQGEEGGMLLGYQVVGRSVLTTSTSPGNSCGVCSVLGLRQRVKGAKGLWSGSGCNAAV